MVVHKGMKISSSEISSFISYVHIIVYEIQVHETATLTFFSGTFVLHLYSNHHKKQEKKKKKKALFLNLQGQGCYIHYSDKSFWGTKRFSSLSTTRRKVASSDAVPTMRLPSLTPPPSSYFYAVCAHIVSFLF